MATTVSAFRFVGNTSLGNDALAASVSGFQHRALTLSDLREAAAAVSKRYLAAGLVVRAFVPVQQIEHGVVTIEVVEAVLGAIRTEANTVSRVSPQRITALAAAAMETGAPLKIDQLDRALLLLNDLPGVIVNGSLARGIHERETDLLLSLASKPLFQFDLGGDNTGSPSTGTTQLTADLTLASPLGLGEQFAVNAMHSQGSNFVRLAASAPLGEHGWRLGANASQLGYRLVGDAFASLAARGDSATAGLEASYPLLRSPSKNLFLMLSAETKRFDNQANGATISRYRVAGATASLNGNLLDAGGATTTLMLALTQGKVDLDGTADRDDEQAGGGLAGHYQKLRYALSRQQHITPDVALLVAVSGQAASKNLDSSEKIYLGGPAAVRAYPSGEAGGSAGQLLKLEMRLRMPYGLGATGFFDWGHVQLNRDNPLEGGAARNSYALKGAGLALAWMPVSGLHINASWARRIGANPNALAGGNDSDGSLVKDRVWLQAQYSLGF